MAKATFVCAALAAAFAAAAIYAASIFPTAEAAPVAASSSHCDPDATEVPADLCD